MKAIKAYRFELRPDGTQQRALSRFAGGLRWVWNQALAEQRRRHSAGLPYAGYAEMCRWLTAWRNEPATRWLATGPIPPQQQTLRRVDEAFRRFFARQSGLPRFKRRGEEPGLRFPSAAHFRLDAANSRIQCMKLGVMRLRLSRNVEGSLKNLSITRDGGRWFASLQAEGEFAAEPLGTPPTLGLDLGVAAFAGLSDGRLIAPLQARARQDRKLVRAQRRVSRRQKGTNRRRRAVDRLGAIQRRIARQRRDWLHKLSTQLVAQHPVLALEDLRVKVMSSSPKGSLEAPGRGVRAKAGLNRAILDQGWGEFRRQLEYKALWAGGRVFATNPAYTSRLCRICGHEEADNRKRQNIFKCVACGHAEYADVNAAKNILAAGHAAWAADDGAPIVRGGKAPLGRPRKRIPTEARGAALCTLPP